MTKFWLVWSTCGGVPTHKHESFESAANEAERLARKSPGRRFEVMERISSCVTHEVDWEGRMPLPF